MEIVLQQLLVGGSSWFKLVGQIVIDRVNERNTPQVFIHLPKSFHPCPLWENAFIGSNCFQVIIHQLVLLEHAGIVIDLERKITNLMYGNLNFVSDVFFFGF